MRSRNQTHDAWEALRRIPPELSMKQVELLVTHLPAMPLWKSWLHYLNLNSILMSAIVFSIVLASLLYPSAKEEHVPMTSEAVTTSQPVSAQPLSNRLETSEATSTVLPDIQQEAEILEEERTYLTSDSPSLQLSRLDRSPPLVRLSSLQLPPPLSNSFIPVLPSVPNDCAPIFPLGKHVIRQFKRDLMQHLEEDQLIKHKKENVLIEVPGGEISVNGKKLDAILFTKYADLLYPSIPPCQGRYLVIKNQFFGVGSYTEDGDFIGLSIYPRKAPVMSEFNDLETSLFSANDQNETRLAEHYLFNDQVAVQDDDLVGLMALDTPLLQTYDATYAVLSGKELRRLKRKLMTQLLKDEWITKVDKEAIIGFHEDSIIINGEKLEEYAGTAYRVLINQFGISDGPRKELHLAPKFFIIGDFGEYGEMLSGQAHGKSMIMSKRMPSGLYADRNFRHLHQLQHWKAQ